MNDIEIKDLLEVLNQDLKDFEFVSQNVEFSNITVHSNYKHQFIFEVRMEKYQTEELDSTQMKNDFLEAIKFKTNLIDTYNLVYNEQRGGFNEKVVGEHYFDLLIVFDQITIDSLGRKRINGKVMDQGMDNTMKLTDTEKLLIEKLRNSEDYQLIKEENGDIIIYDKSPVMNPILILE